MPDQHKAITDSVRVETLSEATCQFFIGEKRAGYVGYGTPSPISWINSKTLKMPLEAGERMAVVKQVRKLMEKLNAKRKKSQKQLADLEAGVASVENDDAAEETAETATPAATKSSK
ncbi:MAG: hypothetical protein AAGF31_00460 [Planctomycetota bacterium]